MPVSSGSRATWTRSADPLFTTRAATSWELPILRPTRRFLRLRPEREARGRSASSRLRCRSSCFRSSAARLASTRRSLREGFRSFGSFGGFSRFSAFAAFASSFARCVASFASASAWRFASPAACLARRASARRSLRDGFRSGVSSATAVVFGLRRKLISFFHTDFSSPSAGFVSQGSTALSSRCPQAADRRNGAVDGRGRDPAAGEQRVKLLGLARARQRELSRDDSAQDEVAERLLHRLHPAAGVRLHDRVDLLELRLADEVADG